MHTKTLLAHKKLWLGLAVLWTSLIAVLCLVSFKKLPTVNLSEADKYVHSIFHLVFTLLWFGYLRLNTSKPIIKAFFLSLCYGIVIEIMQEVFTQTRQADLKDVAANSLGALIAVLVVCLGQKYFRKSN